MQREINFRLYRSEMTEIIGSSDNSGFEFDPELKEHAWGI